MENVNIVLSILASIVAIVGGIWGVSSIVKKTINRNKSGIQNSPSTGSTNIVGNNNTVIMNSDKPEQKIHPQNNIKSITEILFIDDEDFAVIKMLKRAGWKNIKKKQDIAKFDDPDLLKADVVFVDIKGVGQIHKYKNEGIGLAAEIKRRFPNKGVVIYSATQEHDLFDKDIDVVDERLPKNAEPIQFIRVIEQLTNTNERQ